MIRKNTAPSRAVSLFFPEGEKTEMRGGAFLNGKEGRVGFRKKPFLMVKKVSVPCKGNRKGRKDY